MPNLFAVVLLAAAGIAGNWAGTMEKVQGGPDSGPVEEYRLVLKQAGDTITGAIGPRASMEIRNAKLEGSKLTFETALQGGPWVIGYNLQLNGDQLVGAMKTKTGPPVEGKLRFKRQ